MRICTDAEQRIPQALFEQQVRETQNHVARLEQVFEMLGRQPSRKTCYAAKGLVEEGQEIF